MLSASRESRANKRHRGNRRPKEQEEQEEQEDCKEDHQLVALLIFDAKDESSGEVAS
jgi:hypothetical protein